MVECFEKMCVMRGYLLALYLMCRYVMKLMFCFVYVIVASYVFIVISEALFSPEVLHYFIQCNLNKPFYLH